MSEISEQVKDLRLFAKGYRTACFGLEGIVPALEQAADTIESLSAKLQDMCSDGEWIYCADKNHLPEESGEYQTVSNCKEVFAKLNFDVSDGAWFDDGGQYHEVIAWWRVYPYEP